MAGVTSAARASIVYNITHTYDGDVQMLLTPPGGAAIDICTGNGSTGDNFVGTVLDNTCATAVTAATRPHLVRTKCATASASISEAVAATRIRGVESLTTHRSGRGTRRMAPSDPTRVGPDGGSSAGDHYCGAGDRIGVGTRGRDRRALRRGRREGGDRTRADAGAGRILQRDRQRLARAGSGDAADVHDEPRTSLGRREERMREGDDRRALAALGEVCGHTGPNRLLELAPGHRLSAGTVPLTLGDRHVFRTAELDPASGEFHLEGIVDLWSTGPCGESPRQLLSYVQWISTLSERWPATIIACDGGLKSVDVADGTVAPFLLEYWCGTDLTDHGLLIHASGISTGNSFAAMSLRPYPDQPRDEPPPARKLHPKLRTQILEPVIVLPDYLRQVRADAVFAIDELDTLVRIDLADATTIPAKLDPSAWPGVPAVFAGLVGALPKELA